MTDLDNAREWANRGENLIGVIHPDTEAAIEIIQSLPDQWVDAEEVRKIIEEMKSLPDTTRVSNEIAIATEAWKRRLEVLVPSKLPTLADMTPEERKECPWMQAQTWHEVGVVVLVDEMTEIAKLITRTNGVLERKFKDVTPLPDLPKLKWPGSEPESTHFDNLPEEAKQVMKESIEEYKAGQFVDFDSSPRPEDVPVDELWLVSTPFADGVGYRHHDQSYPWFVIYPNLAERTWHVWDDSQITLIHKLVPEPPALPEGMRLADNEEFGRVVTSPWADDDNDYRIFFLNEDARGGANYDFAHESTLTFLDGEANE